MCGICGIVKKTAEPLGHVLKRMNDAQAHRGPDGEGYYLSTPQPTLQMGYADALEVPAICGLGHRRLAILDPEGGAQPMMSEDGQITVLLNGEIYNFEALRDELKQRGYTFRTDTDTEVLIHLYRENAKHPGEWLRKLNGIFALAIWDHDRSKLLLARDHFGVKPLHYFSDGHTFMFSSEIKSILAAGVRAKLNHAALHVFMNIRYVPGDSTLFDGIYRLPPAHYAWVQGGRLKSMHPYYELPDETDARCRDDVVEQVRAAFDRAVERQLLSDVPLGMALSGGLDSSMIVAAAAASYESGRSIRTPDRVLRTFSLGFNEPSDENEDARIVAQAFKTEHHDTKLNANPLAGAADVIRAVEEPKINMLQGYELARYVKQHVKVIFSGLGGDELFAGYDIHRFANTLGRLHNVIPQGLQGAALAPLSRGLWSVQSASTVLKTEHYRIGAQIALAVGDRSQFYCRLRNAWDYDEGMFDRVYAKPDAFRDVPRTDYYFKPHFDGEGNYLDQVLRAEFKTKMVYDFLVNEDRVTSAHGVEGRVPFLDRELVELAFRIPAASKMRGRETKALWKACVGKTLPNRIVRKKKQGFTFSSYHQWQKDLRDATERELTVDWCADTGLFNHNFVQGLLDYKPHPNLRWHYFVAWMMLGVKQWMEIFDVDV